MARTTSIGIYLDTSVPGQLFQPPEWMREATVKFYSEIVPEYEVFISELVLDEIEAIPDPYLRKRVRDAVKGFSVLSVTKDAEILSDEYLEYMRKTKIRMPQGDVLHIAIASSYGIQYLVTWNMRHLAREPTRRTVNYVNYLQGLLHLNIVTPLDFVI